ncbi:(2,3-dihydroxybenzoyl)adenylate synthase [Streptomyces sp. NPDC050509]|uniref:(2,3-dihydroxybenzoyl)adenylate synthase n=1 Tax=Streptomyces sp. NPDC050509 TaxID=3365620 RepID=UPI00379A5CAA
MLDGCTPWPKEYAERYRAEGYWRGESLVDLLESSAGRHGGKTALVQGDRRLSYEELDGRSRRMAAGFRAQGIGAADRVVVQLPNVAEFVVVCFALFRLGAHPVFALPAHRASEIRHLCELSGAVGYVFPGVHRGFDHPALARRIRDEVGTLRKLFTLADTAGSTDTAEATEAVDTAGTTEADGIVPLSAVEATVDPADAGPSSPSPAPDPADVAFFLLSGGTTALPKLIPRTHDDYVYMARAAVEAIGLTEDDTYLAVLPVEFNFTWGCPGVIGTLLAGGTVVLAEDPTPERCFPVIEREGVTVTAVGPSVVQLWLEAAEWLEQDLSSLRTLQVGGSTFHPELAARVGPELGCRVQQVFGMAEGLITFTRDGDPDEAVLTTQGRPISPADEIRIVDTRDQDVEAGTVGELLTRGPYTLRGYYRAPEHNTRAFTEDGFYHSGDLARLTPDGNLVIEGRIKDMINRGGDKVSAGEVEGHLLAHPAIARAAVVPVPDEYLGERICAFVVPVGEPPALRELKAALTERGLAGYKLPDRLEIVAELPLTGLGKTDKKILAAIARGEPAPAAADFVPSPPGRPDTDRPAG